MAARDEKDPEIYMYIFQLCRECLRTLFYFLNYNYKIKKSDHTIIFIYDFMSMAILN